MRTLIAIALAVGIAGVASAYDLGNQAPIKPIVTYPENIPNPMLQGGDTIANATVIPRLPYTDSGTTAGYVDDYQSSCYNAGGAPDVVYRFVAGQTDIALISLCGSSYDTGLSILNSALDEIACNDDFCGLQSELSVALTAGQTYYIIVDGYSSSYGSYTLDMHWVVPCVVPCPANAYCECEPPLVNEYVDNWNGGCNTPGYPFQHLFGKSDRCHLPFVLCGVSGWYLYAGSQYRDTDWYILTTAYAGIVEITADAEYAIYIFELGPQDCASVGVIQQATAGPCDEAMMTIVGPPNTPVWFWVGPTVFADPDGGDNMFDYVVWFTYGYVETEPTTWGTLKALFQ
jgi:hypothetical protein